MLIDGCQGEILHGGGETQVMKVGMRRERMSGWVGGWVGGGVQPVNLKGNCKREEKMNGYMDMWVENRRKMIEGCIN